MSALYIHIPFCERKCFYCSFAVAIGQEHRMDQYVSALLAEADLYQRQEIKTIYFGGGTPSMLTTVQWARLINVLKQRFIFSADCEITVEANPENLDLEKAQQLFDLGVNRISLGIQTFHDEYLRYLGRAHDSFKALSAFNDLRRAGFKNINIDLMYSFPRQTTEEIIRDVQTVLGLGSEHVSLYTLTVEPNSKFYAQKIKEQDNQMQGDQYELVTALLQESGLGQYEVSNFSRAGFESRHNLNCWTGGNYIGLGMSAHSHCDGRRSWNVERLGEYLKRIESGGSSQEGCEVLAADARLREALVFGLRMNRGVDLGTLEENFACRLSQDDYQKIQTLSEQGLIVRQDNRLQVSDRGRLLLDEIAVELI